MIEEWRDIEGYEGFYQVSNLGRVKSLYYHNGTNERILKPGVVSTGYLQVVLCKDKKKENFFGSSTRRTSVFTESK